MTNSEQSVKVYAIQVTGISCTNCANNIKVILSQKVNETTMKINVNVMQEKVYITTNKDNTIQQVMQVLKQTKYKPVNEAILLSGRKQNHRNISFLIDDTKKEQVEEKIRNIVGVANTKLVNQNGKVKVCIEYNCHMVKGRQLGDLIQSIDNGYCVINQKIQGLSQRRRLKKSQHSLKITILVWLYFLIVHMILPVVPFTREFYNKCSVFPTSFGIYSLSVLLNIAITLYIMQSYAKGYIQRAYSNYKHLNTTNMQTLIALGSISAFTLSVFFIIRYTLLGAQHLHMAIMDINDALTSASVIVLTVTIGKHFEKEAKLQIEKITDEIFPQSVLFENMKVQYAQMRNRQLKIINEKMYDVSLIEKGDVLKITNGSRVLVDLIIIQGSLKAVQSARTGNDNIVHLTKGDRLESGALIYQAQDCLAEVENVIENSLLLKLATHVKFAQNTEENNQSGIQAICHKITNVFVRGVIMLSLATVVVWTLLIMFQLVEMGGCKACWIFQRGISVLVASCPCALGLAVPSVIAIILKLAIKSGILIRSNRVFESMNKVHKIAFDKTGTLFNRLEKIQKHKVLSSSYKQEQMWEMIALLQKQIRHPLAQVLYRQSLTRSKVNGTNFNYILIEKPVHQNSGIYAKILEKKSHRQIDIMIGNKKMFGNRNISIFESGLNPESSTQIYLIANKQACMFIQLDTHSDLRPQAQSVLSKINKHNIEVHILSGDSQMSVSKLGRDLKLKSQNLHWQCSSDDKKKWIKQRQQSESVIMVGDGLNDIPCLQEAHIGISINAKSELNINAADIIILSQNLQKILALIRFLKKGNMFIRLNLLWAFAYNIITMPIVAGVFYNWGIYVSPIWSCVAMSCSSLFVVAFSHLLVCFHYDDSLVDAQKGQRLRSTGGNSQLVDSTRQVLGNNLSLQDEIVQK